MTNKHETNSDRIVTAKRNVMHTTLYELRRIVDAYNGSGLPATPEEDFDDVLLTLNVAVAKLDAIDAHPSGRPDLADVDRTARRHLEVVE